MGKLEICAFKYLYLYHWICDRVVEMYKRGKDVKILYIYIHKRRQYNMYSNKISKLLSF